jgi:hypothetical protein
MDTHEIRSGNLLVRFDREYGGAARWWMVDGRSHSVVETDPGATFCVVYDTGQDATQTSPNGPMKYPIDPTAYYIHEMEKTATTYAVRGALPFFWYSHDREDDAIPLRDDDQPQNTWLTKYHNHEPWGILCSAFGAEDTPIWFRGSNEALGGALFVGNGLITSDFPLSLRCDGPDRPPGAFWRDRLLEIPNGRVAFKVTISFSDITNPGIETFGGIVFRMDVDPSARRNGDVLTSGSGYWLTVNGNGKVTIRRQAGASTQDVYWHESDAIKTAVRSAAGVTLECRTHNEYSSYEGALYVYADGKLLPPMSGGQASYPATPTYRDSQPFLGRHIGLYGQVGSNGQRIKFSRRYIFDAGMWTEARFEADGSGGIITEVTVRPADFAESVPHFLWRGGKIEAFVTGVHYPTELKWAQIGSGPPFTCPEGAADQRFAEDIDKPDKPKEFWIGNEQRTFGLYCKVLQISCSGKDGILLDRAHALVGFRESSIGRLLIHIDPSPIGDSPVEVKRTYHRCLWRTSHPG